MPKIVSCGSRNDALSRFRTALKATSPDEFPLLLVDSEDPVLVGNTSWEHLHSRDDWERPANAQENQVHLMVQCMESWFLADVSALETFFGAGFKSAAIANRNDIENIAKRDVFRQLESASRNSKKGAYEKGKHSFDILAKIEPDKVIRGSWFAEQLVDTVKMHLLPS